MSKQLTGKNTILISATGTPTAVNVVTTDNKVLVSPTIKNIDYQDMGNGALGNAKVVVNDDYVTTDFTLDVVAKPSSAAGIAPSVVALLKICGLDETIDAGVSVKYTPSSNPLTGGQGIAYLDGARRNITGIAGDFTFSGEIGGFPKFSFSLKGFTTLEETAEDNPTVTLDTADPFVITSITAVTVGGGSLNLESFDFSMGADIKEVYALGMKEFYVSDYKPTVKVKAIKTKGNDSHWTELKENTKKALVIKLGNEVGKKLTVTLPYCAPVNVSESDSDGKVVYERTWNCENSAGNDNFEIKYS